MSVQRTQFEITSTEFLDWMVYLDEEESRFKKQDYYLANIAAEIRRSFVKHPEKVKTESFLMQFKKKVRTGKLSIKERTKRAKRIFGVPIKRNK